MLRRVACAAKSLHFNIEIKLVQVPPEMVSMGLDPTAADWSKAADATCFEMPASNDDGKKFVDFNNNLKKASAGFIPDLALIAEAKHVENDIQIAS